MKIPKLKRKLLITLLAFSLTYGMTHNLLYREARAQFGDDIDSVMDDLDADFQFGNKEDIKQSQLRSTNEQLREDIQIKKEEETAAAGTTTPSATTVNVVVTITELGAPNAIDKLKVTFPATIGMGVSGPVLTDMLDGSTVTKNVNVPVSSTLKLAVQCLAASTQCDYNITIISGATFTGTGASTGPQMLSAGSSIAVFTVQSL